MNINKQSLQPLKADILAALAGVAKKHGVTFEFRGGTFEATSAVLKLSIMTVNPDGSVESPERDYFRKFAPSYGFQATDLDRTFTFGAHTYTISGWRPNASKQQVCIKRTDGKLYKMDAEHVLASLKRTVTA